MKFVTKMQKILGLLTGAFAVIIAAFIAIIVPVLNTKNKATAIGSDPPPPQPSTQATFLTQMVEFGAAKNPETSNVRNYGVPNPYVQPYSEDYKVLGTFNKDIAGNFYMFDDWDIDTKTKKNIDNIGIRISLGEYGQKLASFVGTDFSLSVNTPLNANKTYNFASSAVVYKDENLNTPHYSVLNIPYKFISSNSQGQALKTDGTVLTLTGLDNSTYFVNNQEYLLYPGTNGTPTPIVNNNDGFIIDTTTTAGKITVTRNAIKVLETPIENGEFTVVGDLATTNAARLKINKSFASFAGFKYETLSEGTYTLHVPTHNLQEGAVTNEAFNIQFDLLIKSDYFNNTNIPQIKNATPNTTPSFDIDQTGINKVYAYSYNNNNTQKPVFSFAPSKFKVTIQKFSFKKLTKYTFNLMNNSGNKNLDITKYEYGENGAAIGTYEQRLVNHDGSVISFNLNKLGSYSVEYESLILKTGKYIQKTITNMPLNKLNLMNYGFNAKYSNNKTEPADFYVKNNELDLDDLFDKTPLNGGELSKPVAAVDQAADITGQLSVTDKIADFTSPAAAIDGKKLVKTNQAPVWLDRVANLQNSSQIYFQPLNTTGFVAENLGKNDQFSKPGTYVIKADFEYHYSLVIANGTTSINIPKNRQVFAFIISHQNPETKIEKNTGTDATPVWEAMPGNGYTNTEVKFTATKASIFDAQPKYTFSKTTFDGAFKTLNLTGTVVGDEISYIFTNKETTVDTVKITPNAKYSIEVKWGLGDASVTYQFTIDTLPIELIPKANTKTGSKELAPITANETEAVENEFQLSWAEKKSGAKITTEYAFTGFTEDSLVTSDSTAILKGDVSSAIAVNQTATPAWMNNTIYLQAKYKLLPTTAFVPYVETSKNAGQIFNAAGIYQFNSKDEAGNTTSYYIVIDKTKPNMIKLEGKFEKGGKTSPTHSVIFGDFKTIDLTQTNSISGQIENFVFPTKNLLGSKDPYTSTSTVFEQITDKNSKVHNCFKTGITANATASTMQDTVTFKKRNPAAGDPTGAQTFNDSYFGTDAPANARRKCAPNGIFFIEVKANEGMYQFSFTDKNSNASDTDQIIINFDLSNTTTEVKNKDDKKENYVNNVFPTITYADAFNKDYATVDSKLSSTEPGASFTVDSIKYAYQELNYTPNLFEVATTSTIYDSTRNELGHKNPINVKPDKTAEGFYIVTRRYKEGFVSPVDIDNVETDSIEISMSFMVDRNKVINLGTEKPSSKENKITLQGKKDFTKLDVQPVNGKIEPSFETNLLPAYANLQQNKYAVTYEAELTTAQLATATAEQKAANDKVRMRNAVKKLVDVKLDIEAAKNFSLNGLKPVYTNNKLDVETLMANGNDTAQYYRNKDGAKTGGFFKADTYKFSLTDYINNFIIEKQNGGFSTAIGNNSQFVFKLNNEKPVGGFYNGTTYEELQTNNQNSQLTHIELDKDFNFTDKDISTKTTTVKQGAANSKISFAFEDPLDEYKAKIDLAKTTITKTTFGAAGKTETITMPVNTVKISDTRNRYYYLLDNSTECIYKITLKFTGEDVDYQLNNATLPAEKTYFNAETYTLIVDGTKPVNNVTTLIKPDTFLIDYLNFKNNDPNFIPAPVPGNPVSDEAITKIIAELNKGDLKDYAFKIDGNHVFTKATTNPYGVPAENSAMLDTYKLFYRKIVNHMDGAINYALPSILPDEADYNTSNKPSHIKFNENDTHYFKLKYDENFAMQVKANGTDNGYYEIIECDEAGNYRSYYVYLASTAENVSASVSYRNKINGNDLKTETLLARPEDQVINALSDFKINAIACNDLWFKVIVEDLIDTAKPKAISYNNGTFDFYKIKTFIESNLTYTPSVGNQYKVVIQNRFGTSDLNLIVNFAQASELYWSSTSSTNGELIFLKSPTFNKAHNITNLAVYKSVANGKMVQIIRDKGDKLITTSSNQTYTLDSGIYKVVQTDNFGRTTTQPFSNVSDGDISFKGVSQVNNISYATTSLSLTYQPLLYQVSFYYKDLDSSDPTYRPLPYNFILSEALNAKNLVEVKFATIPNVNYNIRCVMTSIFGGVESPECVYNSKLETFKVLDNKNDEQPFSIRKELRTNYGKLQFDFGNNNFGTTIVATREYTIDGKTSNVNLGTLLSGYEFNLFGSTYYLTIQNGLGFHTTYTVKIEDEKFLIYEVVDKDGKMLNPSNVMLNYNYNGTTYNIKQFFTNDANYLVELSKTKQLLDPIVVETVANAKFILIKSAPENTSFSYFEIIKITVVEKTNTLTNLTLKADTKLLTTETAKPKSTVINYNNKEKGDGNYYYAEISYGDKFVMNNYTGEFTLSESGEYRLTFKDLAGNIQLFNNLPFVKVHIASLLMADVVGDNFTGSLINNIVLNEKAVITIPNPQIYTKISVTGKLNNNALENLTTENLTFTKFGYYELTFKYILTSSNTEYSTSYTFFVIGKNESKLGLEYNVPSNYNIYKIYKKSLSDLNDKGSDITDLARDYYGNSNPTVNLTRFPLSSYTFGDGRYTVFVDVNYSLGNETSFKPNVNFQFDILISNAIPIIRSNVFFGQSTTKTIVLTYNAGEIFENYGDININIYTQASDGKNTEFANVLIDSKSVKADTKIELKSAGTYIAEISYPNSSLILSRMSITKKDPLNWVAILLIVLGVVTLIVGLVLFLVLRNKMKVR